MLYEFVTVHREEIISRCKVKVATRGAAPSPKAAIDHGVPVFLDELLNELRLGSPNAEIRKNATQHGHDLLREGFSVSQVVHGYGDVCQSITEIAVELNAPISADDFRTLNRCLDDAIAAAVTEYGREREHDRSVEGEAAGQAESLKVWVQGLRTSIHSARIALEAIKSGRVGIAGSTGTVLDRNLLGAHDLTSRLLAEINAIQDSTAPLTEKK